MPTPQEIELKLLVLLPSADEALRQLRRAPALRRRRVKTHDLLNRYFDTPDLALHRLRCALRLRQTDGQGWKQTLKTAGTSQGGLSQRGEWESPVPTGRLDPTALQDTAWDTLDPDGRLWHQLAPCFETRCRRSTWQVRTRDGSHIEVAFDAGEVVAGNAHAHWLELELELLQGPAERLFDLADQLATHLALLPSDISKAERGYALANGTLHVPQKARPVALVRKAAPLMLAVPVLAEIQGQLQRNLEGLRHSNDPELVHQARVAWRRWRSVHRLLRPWLPVPPPPADGLRLVLDDLGPLRDLDVALTDTLPAWQAAYTQGNPEAVAVRERHWHEAVQALQCAADALRHRVRGAMVQPALGQYLIASTRWLHALATPPNDADQEASKNPTPSSRWATDRLKRWHREVRRLLHRAERHPQRLHDARLLAKRLRYASEAIQTTLPKSQLRRNARWTRRAQLWQESLGRERDLDQAVALLQQHGAAEPLVAFMRGARTALQTTPTPR